MVNNTIHIFRNKFHIKDCISNFLHLGKMQNIQMLVYMSTVEGFYY